MKSYPRKPRLEVVSFGNFLLVTIGAVSLVLDRVTAEEITCHLFDALEPADSLDLTSVEWN